MEMAIPGRSTDGGDNRAGATEIKFRPPSLLCIDGNMSDNSDSVGLLCSSLAQTHNRGGQSAVLLSIGTTASQNHVSSFRVIKRISCY